MAKERKPAPQLQTTLPCGVDLVVSRIEAAGLAGRLVYLREMSGRRHTDSYVINVESIPQIIQFLQFLQGVYDAEQEAQT
jgi:hypothetical protein